GRWSQSVRARTIESSGTRLDEVEHLCFQARTVKAIDLLDAGRAGDVHLGDQSPDHVQADEPQPIRPQPRPHAAADLTVAIVERRALDASADVDVPPVLVLTRPTQHPAGRLTAEHDESPVALAPPRQLTGRHHPPPA